MTPGERDGTFSNPSTVLKVMLHLSQVLWLAAVAVCFSIHQFKFGIVNRVD